MKLFITGASSTLGMALTSELLKNNKASIRLLEHHLSLPTGQFEIYRGDIQDFDFLVKACSGIDIVFHLAAVTHSSSAKTYFEVNKNGTERLIAACKKNNVKRIIFVSSSAASEEGGSYAASKFRSEKLVRESGLEWVILRISEVYGPNLNEGIAKLMLCVKTRPVVPVIGNGRYLLSPVHVDDVTQAMAAVLEHYSGKNDTLYLCGPEKMTMNELISRLARIQNRNHKTIFVPLWLAKIVIKLMEFLKPGMVVSDQIPRLLCDKEYSIAQTQALISYNPRTLEEGVLSFSHNQ